MKREVQTRAMRPEFTLCQTQARAGGRGAGLSRWTLFHTRPGTRALLRRPLHKTKAHKMQLFLVKEDIKKKIHLLVQGGDEEVCFSPVRKENSQMRFRVQICDIGAARGP